MHEGAKLAVKRSRMGGMKLGGAAVTSTGVIEGCLCLWWSTLGRMVGKRGGLVGWRHCARGCQACGEETSYGWHGVGVCCCDFNGSDRRLLVLVVVNARPEGEQERVAWLGEVLSVEVAALCTRVPSLR